MNYYMIQSHVYDYDLKPGCSIHDILNCGSYGKESIIRYVDLTKALGICASEVQDDR